MNRKSLNTNGVKELLLQLCSVDGGGGGDAVRAGVPALIAGVLASSHSGPH